MQNKRHRKGFTLIELLVVLAIVAVLLSISVPRYFNSMESSRETVLIENLRATRDAIDKFSADNGRYPDSLQELAERNYLRAIPVDPILESNAKWTLIPPNDATIKGNVADLKSSAPGKTKDGRNFTDL